MTIERSQSVHSIVHDNRMLAKRAFYCLQQLDSVGFRFFADFSRPDGALYFSDVRLAQEEHTDTGLTDTAADCIRKLSLQNLSLIHI